MNRGKLFIVSGPSGSGKDTVLKKIFENHPEIKLSVSSITRAMRTGEKEGEKYHFISRAEFEKLIKNDELLEHNVYLGNYYGTPKAPVEKMLNEGSDVILEVDVNGAAQVRQKVRDAVSIFIMPPSFEELRRRLSSRGTESKEVVEERLSKALGEIKRAAEYDYIVVNDELNAAADDLLSIILSERLRIDRKKYVINEVLKKC